MSGRSSTCAILLAWLFATRAAFGDLGPARTALARGDYAVAEQNLRTLPANERADGDRLLGRIYLETGRYEDARQLGQRLARAAATRVDGLTLEAEALAIVGNYDDAIARWQQAIGRNVRAGSARRAHAMLAGLLSRLGRRQDAMDAAQPLVDEYNDAQQEAEDHPDTPGHLNPRTAVLRDAEALTYLAMAARVLGYYQDANDAFNHALRVDAHRPDALIESAVMYLDKEDMGHAGEALREVLRANTHHARALFLRARTRLMSDMDFDRAREDLDAATRINARMPEAMVLRAQLVLRDGNRTEADRLVDAALAINPRNLEALAMRAVIQFWANDTPAMQRALEALFAIAPTHVDVYSVIAEFADWEHRYESAIGIIRAGLLRPAIANEPRVQGPMRAVLAMNLLRMGDEEQGLVELRESFRRDRYNVRVFNLLNLYEDTLAHDYSVETSGPFRIRYHNEERPVMSRYVPVLLRRAYDDMVARYHFTPRGPISIEMFASTEHFSVRTAGLPEIGVQGVCFGRVITAISPRAGPFNWGQILWHELGHVFAIQLSNSRVPRWFTEGLSEWEAFHSHPEWSREDDGALYRAMVQNRVPHVADFNSAFTHAHDQEDMLVAYYAASRLVEFMIDRYGFDRIVTLLPRWGRGQSTPDVLREGLGVRTDELDRLFRAHVMQRLARFANQFAVDPQDFRDRARLAQEATAHATDANALARSAVAELIAGSADTARTRASAAVQIDARSSLAHWVLARVALASRDGAGALREIDAILGAGRDGFELRVLEARAARAAHDDNRVRAALEAATRQDPSQSEPWQLLSEMYRRANRADDALAALRNVVRLDQHNRDGLRLLLRELSQRALWREVRALTEHARNLDPEDSGTHVALARAAAETGARPDAIFEYESALLLAPREPAPIHTALARLYLAANDRTRALSSVRAALSAQPNDAEARTLARQLGVR